MKAILVDVQVAEDKNTGIQTAWCVMTKVAQKSEKTGKLFHFNVKKDSKNPMIVQYAVVRTENEELFTKLVNTLPGALVDIELVLNNRGTASIKDIVVIKKSPYTAEELFC